MNTKKVWYSDKIDINSPDAVHQILMYGNLQEIKSLKKTLGEKKVKELFLSHPKKVYTAPALNFIKNFILNIPTLINEQKYLKSTPRNIG
ncbi:MAG: hypothetical protein Q7R43_01910 [Candidatus Daviesbacteria bacterium]|nr:hypothetical protein [Candidatus Daviesbacteria bacterium]